MAFYNSSDDEKPYATRDFDDDGWKTGDLPQKWQNFPGLEKHNGIGWFRKTVEIPAGWEGRELVLRLGKIDDDDITWWNGVEIGRTQGWTLVREYRVPAELVKAGKAVVAVRVLDTSGAAGIYEAERFEIAPVGDAAPAAPISLAGAWKYRIGTDELPTNPPPGPRRPGTVDATVPSALFRNLVEPVIPYAIRGAIWYQGESNAFQWKEYRTLFPDLIRDWRERWGYDFPFYWAQLANYQAPQQALNESGVWHYLREAQTMALALPATGQAILIDNANPDDPNDIHPRNKQDVGRRLALIARKNIYGEPDLVASGPTFRSMEIKDGAAVVTFDNVGGGLRVLPPGRAVNGRNGRDVGFALAGADGKYVWADSVIINGATVTLTSAAVANPVSVRYGWATNPVASLYNAEGLPAGPFRVGEPEL